MTGKDYWKKSYEPMWDESSKREEEFKAIIESQTGLKLEPAGLGAESTEYIKGSASDNGYEKGSADYHVVGTNIYIEVTGSFSKYTKDGDPIWFRPDKIENAKMHLGDHDTFLANNFKYANMWYIIHYTNEFDEYSREANIKGTDCQLISKNIRDKEEHFIEIKSSNPYIMNLNDLIEYLKQVKYKLKI